MSCSGLHCAGCAGGAAIPAFSLAAICGCAWVAEHLIEVVAVSAGCGVLAVAAVVALMRWADRRDSRPVQLWSAREVTATMVPQVSGGSQPAIENHYHGPQFNFYGPDAEATAARVARAIPGLAGNAIGRKA